MPDLSIPGTPIDRRNASGERVRPLSGGTRDSAEEPEARIMSVQAGTRYSELRRPQFCLAQPAAILAGIQDALHLD